MMKLANLPVSINCFVLCTARMPAQCVVCAWRWRVGTLVKINTDELSDPKQAQWQQEGWLTHLSCFWPTYYVSHSLMIGYLHSWEKCKAGRLQSMGLRRVRHDWATSLSLFPFMHWRRKWQPTPVFLPGESQGWGILLGCRLWGCTESDTTEVT